MLHVVDNRLKNTFRKQDKLKSSLTIEKLYKDNHFVLSHPLKCYYSFSELPAEQNTVRVAFTVPKRAFKNAVQRNKLKRKMREAYRLHYRKILEQFVSQSNKQLQLLIIFTGKETLEYRMIEKNIKKILQKVNDFFFNPSVKTDGNLYIEKAVPCLNL
jgi:ribonuclease P protein component